MAPQPTGRLDHTSGGHDLILTRSFQAGIDDVWASITESDRTAKWFVSWTGDAGPGKTIRCTMMFEEGSPQGDMTIDACDAPSHLGVRTADEYGGWRLEATLAEHDGVTVLSLIHHLDDGADVGSIGPGWEYYLDNLVASRSGSPLPAFTSYYPAQKAHYEGLA